MNIFRRIAQRIAKTEFGSKAMNENADLNVFREKPPAKVIIGISLIIISYIIGWPMIGLSGALSLYWNEPLWAVIGGPLFFGVSHLTFFSGLYLAGSKYIMPFLKWATRITLKKLM